MSLNREPGTSQSQWEDKIAGACSFEPRKAARPWTKTGMRTGLLVDGALKYEAMEPPDLVCEPPLRLEAH